MKRKKIMIVDDDRDFLAEMKDMLSPEDYDVFTDEGGKETVGNVQGFMPDVVLLDLRLKGISGLDIFKELREKSETKDIPVVIITGAYTSLENTELTRSYGIDDYLIKPFDYKDLILKIENKVH